jgi:hypothetical protein
LNDEIVHVADAVNSNTDDDNMVVAYVALRNVDDSCLVDEVDIHSGSPDVVVVVDGDTDVAVADGRADLPVLPDCMAQPAKTHRRVVGTLAD